MKSITTKLILAFLTVSLLSTLLVILFTRWRSNEEFRSFLLDENRPSVVTALSDYYLAHGSWEGITNTHLLVPAPPPRPQTDKSPFTLVDDSGRIVLAGEGFRVGDSLPADQLAQGIPILVDGKIVGRLLISRANYPFGDPGSNFISRINRQVFWSGLLAMILALLLAIILSRTLTRPIRELTAATQVVSEGQLAHQVPIRSQDELGQLANSFNRMSADLARSFDLRRQMTADIAHELRTPLSLILGHAEAVHDGVLPPTLENFEIIRDEAARLERLVEDLRTLSLADAGELSFSPQPVGVPELLNEVTALYQFRVQQKGIALELNVEPNLPKVNVDSMRLTQVLTNVLDNALRYSPDKGRVVLSARGAQGGVEILVEDSGPGVPAGDLDHIFDRFYRTDSARAREGGGSGLGLAIAKSIIELHGGQIKAEPASHPGLVIRMWLPAVVPG